MERHDAGDPLKVLVIAPRFPSANQPWVDTYLQRLRQNHIDFGIYSTLTTVLPYAAKVDELGLKDHLIDVDLSARSALVSSIRSLVHPRDLMRAWSISGEWSQSTGERARSVAKALHFRRSRRGIGDYDVIHSHAESLAFEFLHLAAFEGVPVVLSFHGLPPAGVGSISARKREVLYQKLATVLVNTEFAKTQVCARGCPPEKVRVLPQGLPLEDFPFSPAPAPLNGRPLEILSVGRFHPDKGHGYAMIAARRLLDAGLELRWRFVGAGDGGRRLARIAKRLGILDHVEILKGIPNENVRRMYQEADLFVLASVARPGAPVETQGVVLQEAQASGCIPIATRVGGIPECVNDQQDAILVEARSSREIAAAVVELVASPSRWGELQAAGRRNVEENFSADAVGEEMASILRGVVS